MYLLNCVVFYHLLSSRNDIFLSAFIIRDRKRIYVNNNKGKGKGKVHPITGHEGPEGSRGIAILFNLVARWGGWSTPRPGLFTPGKDPVLIV